MHSKVGKLQVSCKEIQVHHGFCFFFFFSSQSLIMSNLDVLVHTTYTWAVPAGANLGSLTLVRARLQGKSLQVRPFWNTCENAINLVQTFIAYYNEFTYLPVLFSSNKVTDKLVILFLLVLWSLCIKAFGQRHWLWKMEWDTQQLFYWYLFSVFLCSNWIF